jgi:rubredoxin
MTASLPTVSFLAQGNRQNQTGQVLGRMGNKLLIAYRIQSGELRERWLSASRYDLETLTVPFEDLPRYVAPVCKAQPTEAEAWAAGPNPRIWRCPKCGGDHQTEIEWAPTAGDLGASYGRTLEIADQQVEADNEQRRGWNRDNEERMAQRPQLRPIRLHEMEPLPSTLYPTLADFREASRGNMWLSLPTDQVPEWPGVATSFRVTPGGAFLVCRMARALSLKAQPRLA